MSGDDWQALVAKYELPLGKSYLYCPRGPIIQFPISNFQFPIKSQNSNFKNSNLEEFIEEIRVLAERRNVIFARIEPTVDISEETLKEKGFIKSLKDVQPAKTLILDLEASEEELLGQMHEKTRYNIGLAQRKGVVVRKSEYNEKYFEIFWSLMSLTAKRQGIRIFPKEYYRKQFLIKGENFENILFIAEYQGKPIAANLVNFFGGTATYLHGGSDNEYRSLMAPHLLQWEQIKEAKNRGCKIYDFWGIDEQKWSGVTRFKNGFGGREVQYIGTWDLVLRPRWYKIYKLAKRLF